MAEIDEQEILRRFRAIAQFQLNPERTERDLERARAKVLELTNKQEPDSSGPRGAGRKNKIVKYAAAAMLMIALGYGLGRLTAAKAPDIQEIRRQLEITWKPSLKTEIRETLHQDLSRQWQEALRQASAELKKNIYQQYRSDMYDFTTQTASASQTLTRNLLRELTYYLGIIQMQDRHRFLAALEQVESNRQQDSKQFQNELQTLAWSTDNEMLRTRQSLAQLLVKSRQTIPKIPTTEHIKPLEKKEYKQ